MENKKKNIIIDLKNLTKTYGDFYAVDNLNLYIRKGEFLTLLGPSGCGKTTTLRMIAGFEMPDEGSIMFNDKDITKTPPHLRHVNTVFQRYALFPHLNVEDNIAFGLKLKKVNKTTKDSSGNETTKLTKLTKAEIAKKITYALKIVGLAGYEARDVNSLSGGQQQRVAIARAIVNEPEILLLDEPLGALDLKMRKDMQIELKEMHQKLGITFIYVTHDQEEALTMSDTVVVMKDGKIQQIGTPTDIYNEPINSFVADFIGESNIIDGVMIEDYSVVVDGVTLKCSDKGFKLNERVDVVIRPEDFYITDHSEKGMIHGKIISSVFKGVHNEMAIKTKSGCEFFIQDTKFRPVGDDVSLFIHEDDIHIMKKMRTENNIEGIVYEHKFVNILDADFECDTNTIYPDCNLSENGTPVDADGNDIKPSKEEVIASFAMNAVILHDDEDDATVGGDIISILFKGDHYQLEVKTDNGDMLYVDTLDQWDDGDRVGIEIPKDAITLKRIAKED